MDAVSVTSNGSPITHADLKLTDARAIFGLIIKQTSADAMMISPNRCRKVMLSLKFNVLSRK